jgi:hypothetical protein
MSALEPALLMHVNAFGLFDLKITPWIGNAESNKTMDDTMDSSIERLPR